MTDCTIFDQGLNFYDHRSLSGYRIPEVFCSAILEAPGLKVFMIDIENEIFGEGSHISTNQRRESTVFSILIG